MGKSNIQWTDFSFNGWIGCRKVADECKNCYAETLDRNRFSKTMPGCSKEAPISHWGGGPRYRTSVNNWKYPVKWNKAAPALFVQCTVCGRREMRGWDGIGLTCCSTKGCVSLPETDAEPVRPRVFCASLSDWLDDENVPIEWLADLLKLIHDTPNLDWLLLSKRPQNWEKRITEAAETFREPMEKGTVHSWLWGWLSGVAPANVWIGVSAGADQAAALQIPAKIHFLSCEPMLRPVDLSLWLGNNPVNEDSIFGGENTPTRGTGTRDRRRGENMEDGGSARNARHDPNAVNSVQTKEGGASDTKGVLTNPGNDRRKASERLRTSVSMAVFQRADSGRDDGKSQIREQGGQSAIEAGASEFIREHAARGSHPSVSQSGESGRREERCLQTTERTSSGNSDPTGERGTTEVNREGPRNISAAGFKDCAGPTSKKWVIYGGESGTKARQCSIQWIRDAVAQCQAAGVPVFVKQIGSNPCGQFHAELSTDRSYHDAEKMKQDGHFKDSHGADMSEWPEDLRVREFPTL